MISHRYSEEDIVMGQELSDLEINFAQDLLKGQNPKVSGLQLTLFQERSKVFSSDFTTNSIQIILCKARHHWVTVSTIYSKLDQVKVFDTMFKRQKGGKHCGLFSIAIVTALAFGLHPSKQSFSNQ